MIDTHFERLRRVSGPLEYQEMVLTLTEPARKKILAKTRKLCRGLAHQLQNPRALNLVVQQSQPKLIM